jgi:hypothetical protein
MTINSDTSLGLVSYESEGAPEARSGDDGLGLPRQFGGQYYFTLAARLEQKSAGMMPGGYRIDLYYDGEGQPIRFKSSSGEVGLDPSSHPELDGAFVLSGSDWVVIDENCVVDFDSRFTLQLNQPAPKGDESPAHEALITGRIRGRGDLRATRNPDGSRYDFGTPATNGAVIQAWSRGLGDGSYLPLILAVTFSVPGEGFDDKHTKVYQRYQFLTTSLLFAPAKVTFGRGEWSPAKSIELDLYCLQPSGGGTGSVPPTSYERAGFS